MLTRFNGVEMIAHYHGDQQCLQENIRLTSDLPGFKRSQCRSFYKSSSNFDGGYRKPTELPNKLALSE